MKQKLEQYLLEVITKKKRGIVASFFRLLLLFMSWPFQLGVMGRNWLFDHGWLRRYSPPVPVVISIGNIVVGGTGKTPVTLMITQEFYEQFSIAVLARGYRSKCENLNTPTVLSHGEGPKRSAEFCGDEPYLIAHTFPKTFVIVGKDRHKASDIAAKFGAQLLLLDDGMQHRRLARDFEVVVMDASDLFGQGYFLPRGLLREGANSLMRADLIIVNHVDNQTAFEETRKKLVRCTKAPIIGTQIKVDQIQVFHGDAGQETFQCLKELKVGLFCGIARPEHFHHTISGLGALVVDQLTLNDHTRIERKALRAFAHKCKTEGAQLLLCTEKDRVKLQDIEELPLPLASVKMRLSLVEGDGEWRDFISKVKTKLQHS